MIKYMVKPKGFKDYLNDDPSLTEKITYEEFERRQQIPANQKDDGVEEAYNSHLKVLETLEGGKMQIKAKELKQGDVFIFNNKEQVAISIVSGNSLWATNRDLYLTKDKREKGFVYGHTNATVISINEEDMVELVENIERQNHSFKEI